MKKIILKSNVDELNELIERADNLGETINFLSKEWIETVKKIQGFEVENIVYKE